MKPHRNKINRITLEWYWGTYCGFNACFAWSSSWSLKTVLYIFPQMFPRPEAIVLVHIGIWFVTMVEFLELPHFALLSFWYFFNIRCSCELIEHWSCSVVVVFICLLCAALFKKVIVLQFYLQLSRNLYGNPTGQRPIIFYFISSLTVLLHNY